MSIKDFFSRKDVRETIAKAGVGENDLMKLEKAAEDADQTGPIIALVGETGVGKSSTINALFGADRPTSFIRPCTTDPEKVRKIFDGGKGNVTLLDMPGLGHSISQDKIHYENYRKSIPECDVVLWIFQSNAKTMTNAQVNLQRMVHEGVLKPERLVVGINKVDVIPATDPWVADFNLPSESQLKSISEYEEMVGERLREIGIDIGCNVVSYSAVRRYNLHGLFSSMFHAVPEDRRWIIKNRKDLASPLELLDPEIAKEMRMMS